MRLKRRTLLVALAVAFVVIIFSVRVISRLKKTSSTTATDQESLVIRVEKVALGQVIDQVKISGTIRPANEVEIFPKIGGRITAINYDVGDRVKAGDVLAVIEHREISLQEKAAKASLAIAKTSEAAAQTELLRSRELFSDRAVAKVQLEASELKYEVAKAQTLGAQAQADIASQQLRNAQVTSLIDGTVTRRQAALGANVSPQASIFTVQDISKLKLVTSVDASTLMRLKKGSSALLNIEQMSASIAGKVVTLSPSLDAHSRRAAVEIEIEDQSGQLVPNMFIDGALVLSKLESVLIVPNRALLASTGKPGLFVIADSKVRLVNPTLGLSDSINTVVLGGLKEGDVVAVSGLDRLHEGSFVTIEEVAK